jgi:hypothetical protein
LLLAQFLVGTAGAAGEGDGGPMELGDDLFDMGASVVLDQPITGDALLAGGTVESNASVGGDATLAGGTVALRATVADDAYAAGGEVEVDALVTGNLRAIAGRLRVLPESRIGGGAALAGGRVEARGSFARYLSVAGGDVTIGGEIGGDLRVVARRLELLPGTRIGGRLRYRTSAAPVIASDVVIAGGTAEEPAAEPPAERPPAGRRGWDIGWIWLAGLAAIGLLFAYGLASFSTRTTMAITARPWLGLGLGTLALLALPAAAGILAITVIGIPLAALLVLVWLVLLLAGFVLGALYVGDRGLASLRTASPPGPGRRVVALLLVLLLLGWVSAIPVLGTLARAAVLAFGVGGILLAFWPTPAEVPPPPPARTPSIV